MAYTPASLATDYRFTSFLNQINIIMKNVRYTSLLVVFTLFIFACKKNNSTGTTDTPSNTKPKKYLTHIIAVSATPGVNGTTNYSTNNVYYTYDSKKRLSTMKTGEALTTYTYNDDGNLYLISRADPSNPNRVTYEFTYADGHLKQYTLKSFKGNVLDAETPYIYVYEGDRVTEIHWEIYYVKYTYDDKGNIVKIFNYYDPQFYNVYTYDDKKSTFINSLFKYPTVGSIAGSFSLNNTITLTTEGLSQNILITYKYNYDEDGYPTGGVGTPSIVNAVTSKYTYEYSTLD